MNVILAAGGYPYTVRHLTFDQHSSVLSVARETLPCRKAVTEYANWVIARSWPQPGHRSILKPARRATRKKTLKSNFQPR